MHRIRPFSAPAITTVGVVFVLVETMPAPALIAVSAVAGITVYWWLRWPKK